MNLFHRRYCRSQAWARKLQGSLMPQTLNDVDLGDDVLEIGPGPGVSTDWLRLRVRRLTSIEIDHKLTESLKQRLANTNVTVVEGDATAMPFPSSAFSSVVCFTMLHHVPSPALQDKLLSEALRVLRPDGIIAGMDSTPRLTWHLYHLFDTKVPVDPASFAERLSAIGFREPRIEAGDGRFFFWARR